MAIDRNLELYINEKLDVLAYRYDFPEDMKGMVLDDGRWYFTDEGKALCEADFNRLMLLCRDYARN